MFLENKYSRWYFQICERAKGRKYISGTHERHHVYPKSLGGKDLVVLTYREHFLCHWLLTKMTIGAAHRKMLFALASMRARHKSKRTITSWQYTIARRAQAHAMTGRIVSAETRARMRKWALENNNHPRTVRGFYVTPWGKFRNHSEAVKAAPMKISIPTLVSWCRERNQIPFAGIGRKPMMEHVGKTPADLGFSFIPLDKVAEI